MPPVVNSYFHQILFYFFPGNCFEELLIRYNVLDQKCAPLFISRMLGVVITVGSSFLLVPQILKICNAKSGYGVSLTAQVLALVAAATLAAYNYEQGFVFGQWGDSFFTAIQVVVIIMQILWYSDSRPFALAFMGWSWCVATAVAYHYVPMYVLSTLQASTVPIVVASKGIQILQNYRNGSTGQLSVISVFMQFAGCVARVFTSIQETGDSLIIVPYAVASFLNGVIFSQIIYYGRQAEKTERLNKKRH